MKTLRTLFALVLIIINAAPALAATPYERAVALMNTINNPQVATPYQLATSINDTTCIDLKNNLESGLTDSSTGGEVTKLQNFLRPKNYLEVNPTGGFYSLTEKAVINFQKDYGISPAVGYVGPITRAKLKEITCGGTTTQTSTTGSGANNTVATVPVNNYNPNSAWWLPPVPTPSTKPADTTGGTNDTGSTTNTTTTTAPPTNCSQYAGVLPNESRKAAVVGRQWPRVVYNYPISTQAQKDLALMQGDLGFLLTFGLKGTGNWNRIEIPSGTVGAWKIKTTEYNQPTYYTFDFAINPETPSGSVFMSVSECPGDFTSPQVMSQTMGYDADNTGNTVGDQKFRNCFSVGPTNGSSIHAGVGGDTRFICALQPNKTYYLNITAGFAGGGDKGPTTPHIGTFDGTTPGTTFVGDFTAYHMTLAGISIAQRDSAEIIKNRTAYYSEARRVQELIRAAGRDWTTACQAALASGGNCNGIPIPKGAYYFQF